MIKAKLDHKKDICEIEARGNIAEIGGNDYEVMTDAQ